MTARAFLHPAALAMGAHLARVRMTRALVGHHRDAGTADVIVRAGLERCWSGRYLTASPGNYRQFWTRDTGFASAALVELGGEWPGRLLSTMRWAIEIWERRRSHITTTINPLLRRPFDLFDYGVDSLPWLLASLRALGAEGDALAREHGAWIEAEVRHYVERVVDPETGLVRSDRHFSAHRDTFRNSSTAYGNSMVAMLGRIVAETGWGPDLLSPYFATAAGGGAGAGAAADSPTDWGSLLREHFWLGDRFRDRLGSDDTSGEANVFPFFTGVIEDRAMQLAALDVLRSSGFATPYPLRFDILHRSQGMLPIFRLHGSNYQTTTIWTSLGSIYLSLLRDVDPAAAAIELERMQALIERDGILWETLDGKGRAWRSGSRLAISDVSMLWSAVLLV